MSIDTRHHGFTLIEMMLTIVVLGIGVAGIMLAFSAVVRASADPLIHRQMTSIAEEMMEEISLKPYAAQANAAALPCARDTFNDISDYNGYASLGQICAVDGTPVLALNGYSVQVEVRPDVIAGVSDAQRITVTVHHGSDNFVLVSWQTEFAL